VSGLSLQGLPRMALVASAYLDLSPGRQADRGALAQALWGESDPRRAAANLREMLARTRSWEQKSELTIFRADGHMLVRDETTVSSDLTLIRALSAPDSAAGPKSAVKHDLHL
jgi:DNA-binding SARP family transcriptional activator